jgi:hypothetical protein
VFWWLLSLTVAGGALSLGGVVVAVLEVRAGAQRAWAYRHREPAISPVPVKVSVGLQWRREGPGPDSIEDRLAELEERHTHLEGLVNDREVSVRSDLGHQVRSYFTAAKGHADDELDALRAVVLPTDSRALARLKPYLGPALIVLGIILSTAAGALALVSGPQP